MKAEEIENYLSQLGQAQILLDRYILPDAQQNNTETIARSLDYARQKEISIHGG